MLGIIEWGISISVFTDLLGLRSSIVPNFRVGCLFELCRATESKHEHYLSKLTKSVSLRQHR